MDTNQKHVNFKEEFISVDMPGQNGIEIRPITAATTTGTPDDETVAMPAAPPGSFVLTATTLKTIRRPSVDHTGEEKCLVVCKTQPPDSCLQAPSLGDRIAEHRRSVIAERRRSFQVSAEKEAVRAKKGQGHIRNASRKTGNGETSPSRRKSLTKVPESPSPKLIVEGQAQEVGQDIPGGNQIKRKDYQRRASMFLQEERDNLKEVRRLAEINTVDFKTFFTSLQGREREVVVSPTKLDQKNLKRKLRKKIEKKANPELTQALEMEGKLLKRYIEFLNEDESDYDDDQTRLRQFATSSLTMDEIKFIKWHITAREQQQRITARRKFRAAILAVLACVYIRKGRKKRKKKAPKKEKKVVKKKKKKVKKAKKVEETPVEEKPPTPVVYTTKDRFMDEFGWMLNSHQTSVDFQNRKLSLQSREKPDPTQILLDPIDPIVRRKHHHRRRHKRRQTDKSSIKVHKHTPTPTPVSVEEDLEVPVKERSKSCEIPRDNPGVPLRELLKNVDIPAKEIKIQIAERRMRRKKKSIERRPTVVRLPKIEVKPEPKPEVEKIVEKIPHQPYDYDRNIISYGGVSWNVTKTTKLPPIVKYDPQQLYSSTLFRQMRSCRYIRWGQHYARLLEDIERVGL